MQKPIAMRQKKKTLGPYSLLASLLARSTRKKGFGRPHGAFHCRRHCLDETETPMRVIMAVLLYPSSSSSLLDLPLVCGTCSILSCPYIQHSKMDRAIRYLLPPISSRKLGRDDNRSSSNLTTNLGACSDHRACTSPHTKVKRGY